MVCVCVCQNVFPTETAVGAKLEKGGASWETLAETGQGKKTSLINCM